MLEIDLISSLIYSLEICENNILVVTIEGDVLELKFNENSQEIQVNY